MAERFRPRTLAAECASPPEAVVGQVGDLARSSQLSELAYNGSSQLTELAYNGSSQLSGLAYKAQVERPCGRRPSKVLARGL